MADATYLPGIYRQQDGDVFVVTSAGEIKIESGGKITADGTQASHIADAETNHNLSATYTDTEVEAALNALGQKINAILAALEGVGILASS